MSDPCLIIIDWQKAFREPDVWGPRNNPDAQNKAEVLLAHWRGQGWPVILIRHDSVEKNSMLRPGQPGNELEDFIQPQKHEPIYGKTVNSAFIGTKLEKDLRQRGLTDLVFCGVTTDHCVNTTVRMASNLGFKVTVASDACFTHDRLTNDGRTISAADIHDAHLASLRGEFASIKTVAQLVA